LTAAIVLARSGKTRRIDSKEVPGGMVAMKMDYKLRGAPSVHCRPAVHQST
jgi:hypothetical protein